MVVPPARRHCERMPHYDSHLAARLGVVAVAALFAAAAIGGVVLVVAANVIIAEPTGDLSEIADAMAVGALGFLAAAVAYITATVIGVRRVVEEGRRAAAVAWT